jgi:hypothetical protein
MFIKYQIISLDTTEIIGLKAIPISKDKPRAIHRQTK